MVCTLEGLAEPQRPDCVQESRCPNAGTLGTEETRSALTAERPDASITTSP